MIPFDLFPSVPRKECINIAKRYLEARMKDVKDRKNAIVMLDRAIKQDFFTFEGKMYKQNEGRHDEVIWRRYVDDVFGVSRGEEEGLIKLLDVLNKQHKNIKFTIEGENGALSVF